MKIKLFFTILFVIIIALVFYGLDYLLAAKTPSYTNSSKSNLEEDSILFPKVDKGTIYEPHIIYTIQNGDNITLIASKYKVDPQLIININKLNNPDALIKDMQILIPEYDETLKKYVLKFNIGDRIDSSNSIDLESKAVFNKYFTGSITQSTIIYNKNNKACVENTLHSVRYRVYLEKFNNDWQVYALEV